MVRRRCREKLLQKITGRSISYHLRPVAPGGHSTKRRPESALAPARFRRPQRPHCKTATAAMACSAAVTAPQNSSKCFVPKASCGKSRRATRSSRFVPRSAASPASQATVHWPDGAGTAEAGDVTATASVANLGARGTIATGLPFLDHMIDQLTSHAQLGVSVVVTRGGNASEPCVDESGTLEEDTVVARLAGAALGQALKHVIAPGVHLVASEKTEKSSASATFAAPLDEAYATCVLDVSTKNSALYFELAPYGPGTGREFIGTYKTALTQPFWEALQDNLAIGVSLKKQRGDNAHHIVEATFKAFARCLRTLMDQIESVDSEPTMTSTDPPHRTSRKARSTKETTIDVAVDLDCETGNTSKVTTGIETLDELLLALAHESGFDMQIAAQGDLWIDDHHTTEDVAITIGQVLNESLGDKAGCNRMGRAVAEVNNCTVEVIADLSNRPYLGNGLHFADEKIGDLSTEMVDHLFMSITTNGQMTAHIVDHSGSDKNESDLALASVKAFGKCLKQCAAIDPRRAGAVASSKGTLSV